MKKTTIITITLILSLLGSCTHTPKHSYVDYGHMNPEGSDKSKKAQHARSMRQAPVLTDALAFNYANLSARILRQRFTGARITRSVSSSLQVLLSALAGAGAGGTFNFSTDTVAKLSFGSALIPDFQGIFNAKSRAQAYQDGARLIEEAITDYLKDNGTPSSGELTREGAILIQRVNASVHMVEKTLAGILPTPADMDKATGKGEGQ